MVAKEGLRSIAIADPFYLHGGMLDDNDSSNILREYVETFMVMNKDKETILLPFFLTECHFLIVLYPQVSQALYLDSSSNVCPKYYI